MAAMFRDSRVALLLDDEPEDLNLGLDDPTFVGDADWTRSEVDLLPAPGSVENAEDKLERYAPPPRTRASSSFPARRWLALGAGLACAMALAAQFLGGGRSRPTPDRPAVASRPRQARTATLERRSKVRGSGPARRGRDGRWSQSRVDAHRRPDRRRKSAAPAFAPANSAIQPPARATVPPPISGRASSTSAEFSFEIGSAR